MNNAIKSFLRKVLGNQNYQRIAQPIKTVRYLKFKIKGHLLKRPVHILLTRYSGLGDVLMATPAIRMLKKIYPRAFIVFDTSKEGKEILKGNPYIDKITVDSSRLMENNFNWHFHLSYEYFPHLHIVDSYLKCIGAKGRIKNEEKKPIIILSDSDREFAKRFLCSHNLSEHNLLIGVHAQAGYEQRRWPLKNFVKVLDYMEKKYSVKIIEFGADNQPTVGKGISLVGKCTVKQSAAVLQKCSLLICNDSLILHVAGALDIPVVAIFGPAPPWTRLPFNNVSFGCWAKEGCRGCLLHQKDLSKFGMDCDKGFPECMYAVKSEEVVKTIEKLLQICVFNKNHLVMS